MATANPLPLPTVPVRGALQKTFSDVQMLVGFTDAGHLDMLIGEYLNSIAPADKATILGEADQCRNAARSLATVPLDGVVGAAVSGPHVDAIVAAPPFQQAFRQRPHAFHQVRLDRIVAVQPHVKPRADPVPATADEILRFALPLPSEWQVPAEVTLIPPSGPIQVMSSVPTFNSLNIDLDAATGRVTLAPSPHINLVQVVEFAGRYYLRNGYHRVFDAISNGVSELPALVVKAFAPNEVDLLGGFAAGYSMGLPRPPMLFDFSGPAAMKTKQRERRYGMLISLDIKPLNVGI